MTNTCKILYQADGNAKTLPVSTTSGMRRRCVGYATFAKYDDALACSRSFEASRRGRTDWEAYMRGPAAEDTSIKLFGYLATEEDMLDLDPRRRCVKWRLTSYQQAVVDPEEAEKRRRELIQARYEEQTKRYEDSERKLQQIQIENRNAEDKLEQLRAQLNDAKQKAAKYEMQERENRKMEQLELERMEHNLKAKTFEAEAAFQKLQEAESHQHHNVEQQLKQFREKERLAKEKRRLEGLVQELIVCKEKEEQSSRAMAAEMTRNEKLIEEQRHYLKLKNAELQKQEEENRKLDGQQKELLMKLTQKPAKGRQLFNVKEFEKLRIQFGKSIDLTDEGEDCVMCWNVLGPPPDGGADDAERIKSCRHLVLPCFHYRLCGTCAEQLWEHKERMEAKDNARGQDPQPQMDAHKSRHGRHCPICTTVMTKKPTPFMVFW
eukprot:evm.model.scf_2245.1 EVM.evm.TU.scf_2245.1   scf_2245:96-2732(+)